jgi:tetratricopeptide (TPR) repeat protein
LATVEAVDRALAGLAQIPAAETSGAETPASLSPNERLVIEAAAGQAARRAAETVRAGLSLRLVRDRLQRERRAAGKLWEQLCRLPTHSARRDRVASDSRFYFWALSERLCDESIRTAAHDSDQSRELAELALQIAEGTPGSNPWRCRLQGYAWAFVGNSLRVGGDLLSSDSAFHRSGEFWEAGNTATPAPLDGARILDLKASLRRYQGRFEEALALHSAALQEAHLPAKKARTLLKIAAVLELQGAYEEALAMLNDTETWTIEAKEPRLTWVLAFSRTANLCHLGQFEAASQVLGLVQRLTLDLGNELDSVRVSWLSARVAAGLGRQEEASARLAEVRQEFARRNIAFDAALAALELAALELDRGQGLAVRFLAQSATPTLAAQILPRELLASLRVFWRSAKREAATAEAARRLFFQIWRTGDARDPS